MQSDDPLFRFSYRTFQVEYVLFKLLLLGFSLYGMYKFAQQEFGITPSTHAAAPSPPVPSESGHSVKSHASSEAPAIE